MFLLVRERAVEITGETAQLCVVGKEKRREEGRGKREGKGENELVSELICIYQWVCTCTYMYVGTMYVFVCE